MWSETDFAEFAFDLLAMMRGTYDGRRSSFQAVHRFEYNDLS
jgi:hypothetical protein